MPSVTPSAAPAELSPRRRELMAAALHVVADEGLRGLTHRAVDRRAELPEGTCSAYFRTRDALKLGLTQYVADRCSADAGDLAARIAELPNEPGSQDAVVALMVTAFDGWLEEREQLLCRLELAVEATRRPELAVLLEEYHGRLVAAVESALARRGDRHDPVTAEALVAATDGLLGAALQKPPAARRTFLADSLRTVLHAFTES